MRTINTYNKIDLVPGAAQSGRPNSLGHGWKINLQPTISLFKIFALVSFLFYGIEETTAQTKTRVIGAANWNTASTWIQLRTGNAAFTNGSIIVTGTGTLFLTELQIGDVLMMDANPGTIRGTVASILTNTSLTLTLPATGTAGSATYGRQAVPGSADNVEIGNVQVSGQVDVTLDVASASINSLTFIADNYSHSLTHASTNNLNVAGSVTHNQPNANNFTISWNISAGSATVAGPISFLGVNNFSRINTIVITSGTLNAYGGISFPSSGKASNRIIDMSGGAGALNLKGALTNSSIATLTAGNSGSIFNYADNSSAQTVNFFFGGAYNNLNFSNTSAGGATLSAAITTANVTGNVRVLSGTMYNGGFAIALNNSKVFEVANAATFKLTGTSGMATGTSITKTFGATSTVDYNGTAQTVSAETYGHLALSNIGVKTMPGTAMIIQGNFTMSGIVSVTALNSITIGGDVTLNSGTFTAGSFTHNVAGNWTNNGGTFTPGASTIIFNGTGAQAINGTVPSQTFNNLIVSKTAGTLLTVNSTTTLQTNDFTETSGNFTASFLTNITATTTSSLTLSSGTFTAGAVINITGNWTNNGGTFIPGSNGIIFMGAGSQLITGTATSQAFYSVTLFKPAGTTLSTGGSTTALTVQNVVETSGDFTAPAVVNINGNRTLNSGVYTAGALTNVTGDWTNNGGTFIPGTGTVVFNGTGAQAINGSVASQTFYNVTIAKTSGTLLNTGGSTTALTINDLTETSGDFTAPATLNINGNLVLTAGAFTAGTTINIQGSWTRNGGTFTSGSNLVNFIGTGTKTLGGSSVTSFYNLTLNTSAVNNIVQLTSNATVTSVLSLTKGVLDLNSKSLSITSGSAGAVTRSSGYILSEKTDNSSKVIWSIGSNLTSHTYPFGTASGSYIPFILNLTAGNIGNVTLSTYPTAANNTPYPSTPIPVTNMHGYSSSDNSANTVDRFWQIDKDGVSGTATLTFTATNTEVGTIMYPTAQRWRSAQNPGWEAPLPGQTNTPTSATVPGVTTFSPWTMSSQATILPIQLVSFNALYAEPFVSLTWVTGSEENSDYFTIERTTDEKTFETIGEVKAAGQSIHTLNYQIMDKNPAPGLSYYRLKQVDMDGTMSYSDFVAIEITAVAQKISISPNPASDFLNVEIESQETTSIQIINSAGQLMVQQNLYKENGSNNHQLDIHNLKPGMYYVNIKNGNSSESKKILKE